MRYGITQFILCATLAGCANVPTIGGHPLWGPTTPEQAARAERALSTAADNMRNAAKSRDCVGHEHEAYCK